MFDLSSDQNWKKNFKHRIHLNLKINAKYGFYESHIILKVLR